VTVDGVERHDKAIPLIDDHQEHWVEVRIPGAHSPPVSASKPAMEDTAHQNIK
jgi:hypothetical protein